MFINPVSGSQCILTPIKWGDYVRSGPQCAIVIRGLCSGTPIRSVWSHPHPDKAQLTNSLQVSRCKVLGDLPWLSTRFFALIDNLDEKKLCIFASLNFMTVREGVVCEINERNYKEGIQRNRQDFFHPASFILLGSAPSCPGVYIIGGPTNMKKDDWRLHMRYLCEDPELSSV